VNQLPQLKLHQIRRLSG